MKNKDFLKSLDKIDRFFNSNFSLIVKMKIRESILFSLERSDPNMPLHEFRSIYFSDKALKQHLANQDIGDESFIASMNSIVKEIKDFKDNIEVAMAIELTLEDNESHSKITNNTIKI